MKYKGFVIFNRKFPEFVYLLKSHTVMKNYVLLLLIFLSMFSYAQNDGESCGIQYSYTFRDIFGYENIDDIDIRTPGFSVGINCDLPM